MRKKIKIEVWLALVAFLTVPSFAMAEPSEWTREATYFDKATHKLGYGLSNVGKGWSEIYIHMIKAHENRGNTLTGLMRGTYYAAADTLGGIFHTVTFFLPVDLPLPEGGAHGFEGSPSAT